MKRGRYGYLFFHIMLCLIQAFMPASASQKDNWETDGLNGGLTISATLTESPCTLAPESAEQEISMGNISWDQIRRNGLSAAVPVHLILENCIPGSMLRDVTHGGNLDWLPSQPVVMMNIVGEAEPGDHQQFHLYGSVSGAALHLEDADRNTLIPGERSKPQVLTPGRNDVTLQAQLIRTSAPLIAGEYQALVTLGLEYH